MTLHRILGDPPHNDPKLSTYLLQWLRFARDAVNELRAGRINSTGTVTLAASVASTTLQDNLLDGNRTVLLQPTTAHAAAEIAAGTLYFNAPTAGSVVINHANNSQADRTFLYVILG